MIHNLYPQPYMPYSPMSMHAQCAPDLFHHHLHAQCAPNLFHHQLHAQCAPNLFHHHLHSHHIPTCNYIPDLFHHHNGNTVVLNMCKPCCPQPKEPVDLSKLAITVNPETGDILNAVTKKSTGQNFKDCSNIIKSTQNNLEISSDGKLTGGCENNSSCKACIDAINSSVVDVRSAVSSTQNMSIAPSIQDMSIAEVAHDII